MVQQTKLVKTIRSSKMAAETNAEKIENYYKLGDQFDEGHFGRVFKCHDLRTNKEVCCKMIPNHGENINVAKREIRILHHLEGHKNIVSIHRAFQDCSNFYIVMELCEKRDLYHAIDQRREKGSVPYSEKDAAAIIKTIAEAVEYCHASQVVHRDIKPENIMLSENGVLKLGDFGLADFYTPGIGFNKCCGTVSYMAPEVVRWSQKNCNFGMTPAKYGPEVDIWSIGVILHLLLSGSLPFYVPKNVKKSQEAILRGKLNFSKHPWPFISNGAKDLIKRILNRNPTDRPTAHRLLCDPWINSPGVAPDKPLDPIIVSRLKNFSAESRFKRVATQVISKLLSNEEIAGLDQIFKDLDVDNSGTISFLELKNGFAKFGVKFADLELLDWLDKADINHNGVLDYQEFVAATIHTNKVRRQEHLRRSFSILDKDKSGTITHDELTEACKEWDISEAEVTQMIRDVDINKDGVIDYSEFLTLMNPENV